MQKELTGYARLLALKRLEPVLVPHIDLMSTQVVDPVVKQVEFCELFPVLFRDDNR